MILTAFEYLVIIIACAFTFFLGFECGKLKERLFFFQNLNSQKQTNEQVKTDNNNPFADDLAKILAYTGDTKYGD